MTPERIIGDASARQEIADSKALIAQGMEQVRKHTALQYMQELQRELERNERVVKLLQKCRRCIHSGPVVFGKAHLLREIDEVISEMSA